LLLHFAKIQHLRLGSIPPRATTFSP